VIKILKAILLAIVATTIILFIAWMFTVGLWWVMEFVHQASGSLFLGAMSPLIVLLLISFFILGWLFLDERE
jgi:hypothetical protein